MIKEALQYVAGLSAENTKTEVLEICGKTYANKGLTRYDIPNRAEVLYGTNLSSMTDYIRECADEFPEGSRMLIHIVNPTKVRLTSALDQEREREILFEVNAEVNAFRFDQWYDQERFMIELQANFQKNADLDLLVRMAGNVEKKNDLSFADDGISQVATMTVGAAAKQDVIVPNPVELIPFRTFQEIAQPASKFVFRIGKGDDPEFKLVEAQNGIWKNEAAANIKAYFARALAEMPEEISSRITVIG